MERAIIPGHPPIEVSLRRSTRARRLSLRVSSLDGRVTLSIPPRLRRDEALAFLHDKEEWLRAAISGVPQVRSVGPGAQLPVAGVPREIVSAQIRHVQLDGMRLLVPERPGCGARVAAWLKHGAGRNIRTACETHAAALGLSPGRITLRDTRSRWGSCSAAGNLSFSWRLAMAPPEVLDYVAAHEVAHLAEMNHSPAYWAVVARLMPDYRHRRDWLRRNGAALHGWQFGD